MKREVWDDVMIEWSEQIKGRETGHTVLGEEDSGSPECPTGGIILLAVWCKITDDVMIDQIKGRLTGHTVLGEEDSGSLEWPTGGIILLAKTNLKTINY